VDGLELAAALRAKSALDAMLSGTNEGDRHGAFIDIAFAQGKSRDDATAVELLQRSTNPIVQKAAAEMLLSPWDSPAAAVMAANWIASIAQQLLLDQIKRYAREIPPQLGNPLVASGFVADAVTEGSPKIVRQLVLRTTDVQKTKSVAIVALSDELLNATGGEGRRLFERELVASITRATNEGVLAALETTSTTAVASSGDALTDLRAGLRAADASDGYVVAASTAIAVDLSTRLENRGGMSVRGGEFSPGISVVAVDSISGLRVIPASLFAVFDDGLRTASAGHASLDMSDTPNSPAQHVSLWQAGASALLAERTFHITTNANIVSVA
jgi:hypothetical protein